ncbi:hypothetical protein TrLO_g6744 [Triparma laevis f. longispina]|uniref:Uncharacterized protein n=1 Tax=Triparma laevis f. longispina TaxID=1714387 RepID=A0A9W7FDR4_9STRA|nr:hypothetical protein TrLO_g6744 [Triparma laevis f. longispina]
MCFLKGLDGERAGEAAKMCINEGKENPTVSGIVVKSRFRRAQAMLMIIESENFESDISLYLDEAQIELALVLQVEPSNEQALDLAGKGLKISQDRVKKREEENTTTTKPNENNTTSGLANNALEGGGGDNPSAAWSMSYMNPGWLDSHKKKKEDSDIKKSEKRTIEANSAASKIITSKTKSNCNITSMVESMREEKRSNTEPEGEEKKISMSTDKSWGKMGKVEETLNSNFLSLLQQRAEISKVAYEVDVKNLKTKESGYSDSWRSKHASRRYEGKEGKHKTTSGGKAWEELRGVEEGAVRIVEKTVERKKVLAERKFLGEEVVVKEEYEGGESVEWRKKLKQRRKGEEIKVKKKKDGGIEDEFQRMMGLEEEEKARVDNLKEQRREAERLSEKKKLKKKKVKGEEEEEGGGVKKKKKKKSSTAKKEEKELADILGSVQLGCAAIGVGGEEDDEDEDSDGM